jgi:hypothetical protein
MNDWIEKWKFPNLYSFVMGLCHSSPWVCHFKWKICFTCDSVARVHSIALTGTGAHQGVRHIIPNEQTAVNNTVCKATSYCDLLTQWAVWVCLHPTFAFWFLGYCNCCFEWFNLRTTWYAKGALEHKPFISQGHDSYDRQYSYWIIKMC